MVWNVHDRPVRQGQARTPIRYGVQNIEGYTTVLAVSQRLQKTKQHIRYLIRTGQLPAIKIADMWLIKQSDVSFERWEA